MRTRKTIMAYMLHTTALCAMVVGAPLLAHAGPENGVVTGGAASISSAGNTTTIVQSSDRAIIRWDTFDLNSAEHVQFQQPSSGSITVNRIRDTKASQIDGRITANGNIVLINPNGLVFGSNAVVDVGGVVATTSDLEDDMAFLSGGAVKFTKPGQPDAKIINNGTMSVREAGLAGLVAPHVENNGVIQARMGRVHLASGDIHTIDFAGDGLIRLEVSDAVLSQSVKNNGLIEADGGTVVLSAATARNIVDSLIVNTGTIRTNSVTNAVAQVKAGSVTLAGSRKIDNTGIIHAMGLDEGQAGGFITLLADAIEMGDGSILSAAGDSGGGTIRIGGDYQGGSGVPTSNTTFISEGVILNADSRRRGNGGTIILWSDDITSFRGHASATGGSESGNGGFIEVSSKGFLDYAGSVDLSSASGEKGTLLLDPTDIVISSGSNSNVSGSSPFTPSIDNGPSVLNVTTLLTALSSGNVIVQTRATGGQTGNITVDVALTWNSGTTLTLDAHNNIIVNQAITGGSLTLIGNDVTFNASVAGTGTLSIMPRATNTLVGLGNSAGGTFTLNATEIGRIVDGWDSIVIGRKDSTAAMDVRALTWNDNLTLQTGAGVITFNGAQTMGDNNLTIITDGNIALNAALTGTATLTIEQASVGTTMGLGNSQLGDVNLTATEITRLTNGWSELVFGRRDGTGTINVGTVTWNDNLTIQSGIGQMNINGVQTMATNALTLITDSNLMLGITNALFGSTTLTIEQASANTSIGLGDTEAGTLHLTTLEVARIRNAWTNIIIGRTDGTGEVNVGELTWNDNLTLRSGTGQMNINGIQTMGANNLTLVTDSNIAINAALNSTGNFALRQASTNVSMGLGDAQAGTVHLTTAELNLISDGWALQTFGNTASSTVLNVEGRSWYDVLALQSGSGGININGDQLMGANNLTMRSDGDIAINHALTGSGTLTIVQSTAGASMAFGDLETGDVHFSDVELDNITNGWAGLVFGRTDTTASMNVGARTWVDPLTLRTGAGQLTLNGIQAMGGNALVITTDSDLAINDTISGTGTLTIHGSAAATTMGLGDAQAGMLHLTNAELARIQGSRTSLILGSTTSTGDMHVGAYSWLDPLTLRTGTGVMHINGAQTMGANNLALLANGDIALNAALTGSVSLTLSGSVTSTTIGIGDLQGGTLHLSDTELDRITDGWTTIIIGATNHVGSINVGARTWNDNTTMRVHTGTLNINGVQTMGTNNLVLQANSNLAINANLIGSGNLSILGSSNSTSIGVGSSQSGTLSLDDNELGRIIDGWSTIIIGGTSVTGAMNVGEHTWHDNLDLRTSSGVISINGAQTFGTNNLTIRSNANLQLNSTLSGSGTLTMITTSASGSIGLGDSQSGGLNLTNNELNRILDGWDHIIFGTTTMTGAMNIGARTWNDNVTFRTLSGAMNINGAQTMGANNLTIQTNSNVAIAGALSGSGTLTIAQTSSSTSMGVGDSQGGTVLLSDTELNFFSNGWSSIVLGNTASTAILNVGARTWQDNLTLRTATGALNINGTQTMGANNLTLQTSSNVNIGANLSGSGILTITPTATNIPIGIGTGQGGTLLLSDTELDRIVDGWSMINIGRTDSTGAVLIGAYTWRDNLTINSGTGQMTIVGAQTMGANNLTLQTASNLAVNATLNGTGILSILGSSLLTEMGIGTGQAGTLSLINAELDRISNGWSLIQFGRTDSSAAVNIGAYTWSDAVRFVSGNNIVINGDQVSTEASGTTLTFVTTGGAFINNAGDDAINPGGGRYLVYSVDENHDTLDDLVRPTVVTNKTYAGYGPGSVVENGDVFIYSGVVARVLLIQIDDASKEYGGLLPTFTYTVLGGLQSGDLLTDVILGSSFTAVGSSVLDDAGTTRTITGSFSTGLGYTVTLLNGTMTVTKATLTVTGDDDSRIYGDANPGLTLTYSGFRNGDDETDLDTLATASTIATTLSDVGAYAIVGAGAADSNYDFTYVNGTLTINKATLTATAQNASRVYGDDNPTFTFAYTGFKNGQNSGVINTGATGATIATATSGVGNYVITGSGAVDDNYTFNYVNGTMTVTKAMLTATAEDKNREYGESNPALTVAYTGFKNGEAAGVINTQATASTTANALSEVGGHVITVSGASDDNYNFTYVNGTLTVDRATITVTAQNDSREYGEANPGFTVAYSGFKNGQNESVLTAGATASSAATATTDAGTHAITATGATADNYNFSYVNGVLSITKATVNVSVQDESREYGEANPAFTISYGGFKNGEDESIINTLASASSAGLGGAAGTHAITLGGAIDNNYNFTYSNGTLTVTKATLHVTPNNVSRYYNTPDPAFTVTYTGFKNGENAGVIDTHATVSTLATLTSPVGPYTLSATGALDGNYDFTYGTGILTVLDVPPPPPPSVTPPVSTLPSTAQNALTSGNGANATQNALYAVSRDQRGLSMGIADKGGMVIMNDRDVETISIGGRKRFFMAMTSSLYSRLFGVQPSSEEYY